MRFFRKLKLFYLSKENFLLRVSIFCMILFYSIKYIKLTSTINISNSNKLLINYINNNSASIRLCDSVPPLLSNRLNIKQAPQWFKATMSTFTNDSLFNDYYSILNDGGSWKPPNCTARHRVAIVVPYKNRFEQLNNFLFHMHPFLQRQELHYRIFVVEQANDDLFNKGILMNACFKEILALYTNKSAKTSYYPFDCVIFHDVDLLPEDDRIMYTCPMHKARHLSVAIDKFKYKMFYYKLIGGVLNFKTSHFIRVNGYSNEYWGWGGEDDDMEARLTHTNIGYERPNINIAHYKMLKHNGSVKNPIRRQLLKKAVTRYLQDGVNNVKYKLLNASFYKMFTHFLVDVGTAPASLIKSIQLSDQKQKNLKTSRIKANNFSEDTSQNNQTQMFTRVIKVYERFKKPV